MKLLFFYAPWDATSCAIKPDVPAYAEFINTELEEGQKQALAYNIGTVPMFITVDDEGKEIDRFQTTNMDAVDLWYQTLCSQ